VNRATIALASVVAAAVLVSLPLLWTSFIGDDAFYANVDGWLAAHHTNLLDAFRTELLQEDLRKGRFHPLFVVLSVVQFHFFHDPLPLKIVQVLAIGLNVATVWLLMYELTRNAGRATMAAAFAVLALQLRFVADATTSDTLHLQLTAECGLLALWALAYAVRTRRPIPYLLAVVSYAAAALFYEIMLPLVVPLVAVVALAPLPWRRRVLLILPVLAVAAADAFALAGIREAFPQPAGAIYAPQLDAVVYLRTAGVQLVSTLPFLYELIDPHGVFHATGTYWPLGALCVIAVIAAIAGWIRGDAGPADATGSKAALIVGATLVVAPALLVAASPALQAAIALGVPYAPVYLQGFGVAIAAAALPLPRGAPRALAVAGAAALLVLLVSNALVATRFGYWKYPRATIVTGLQRGVAANVPSGARFFLDDSFAVNNALLPDHILWNSTYFYRLWGGRTWDTAPLATERLGAGERAYELRSTSNDAHHGKLIVAQVEGRGAREPVLIAATIYERGTAPIPSAFAPADFVPQDHGDGWTLVAFRPHCAALARDALIANAPSVATVAYGDGFSVAESDGTHRWRWGGRSATIAIGNDTGAPVTTEFAAGIGTVGGATGTVGITTPEGAQRVAIASDPRPLRVRALIGPHGRIELRFAADAPNVAAPGDARDLRFRLVDVALRDRSGCAAPDAN